jgi:hypothetical protein
LSARYECGDLGDPGRTCVGDQLCRQRRTDTALLVLVGDLECDLGVPAVANQAGDRDRQGVTVHVADGSVVSGVDGGQPAQLLLAEVRLHGEETAAA